MKILYTSDLHSRRNWQKYLLTLAPEYDLLILAGDMLDMFKEEHIIDQLRHFHDWAGELQKHKVALALCSGNHDSYQDFLASSYEASELSETASPRFTEMLLSGEKWMRHLPPVVCGDGQTICFQDQCILTSCAFGMEDFSQKVALREQMKSGYQLRKTKKLPWIVIHHEPPVGISLSMDGRAMERGNAFLSENLKEFQPDIVLSGHVHNAPFIHQTCREQFAHSHCFNVGHRSDSTKPHWVDLTLKKTTAEFIWHHGDKILEKGKISFAPQIRRTRARR